MTKREDIRKRRNKQTSNQRWIIILIIALGAIGVAAILIAPSLAPIGEIATIKAIQRPSVNGNSMGDPKAPVKVEVYTDFQCPACKIYSDRYEPSLLTEYIAKGKVYYTSHSFSFIGEESFRAAEAAYCAMDQERYWDYHDLLYANQTGENIGDFKDRRLVAFAETLGLNMENFKSCFNSGKYKQRVLDEYADGEKRGVTGTPTLFVNNKQIKTGDLFKVIDDLLKTN
ncbi:MAG TPA: thioredoxin domain-containing protein [Anaerolineaceae bacterium]